jgi:hypothetical protein
MSYIGIATSINQPIDIPIIIRSLADIIGLHASIHIPVVFTPEFIATLDLDRRDSDCNYRLVEIYQYQWWTGRKARDIDTVPTLNAETMLSCIEHYHHQLNAIANSSTNQPSAAQRLSTVPSSVRQSQSLASSSRQSSAGHSSAGPSNPGFSNINQSFADHPHTSRPCEKCVKFKDILSVVLQDILKFRNFASTMTTTSSNLLQTGIRKASTFYLLHEAAIIKETADVGQQVPTTSNTRMMVDPNEHPDSYLDRVASLPASSYKWTWGISLSEDDVLALHRTGTNPGRQPHSGYDLPLKEGRLLGDNSADPSSPTIHGQIESLPEEASFVPPHSHLPMPEYFTRPDRLEYNPHRSTLPFSVENLQSISNEGNISAPNQALDVAEQWGDSEDDHHKPPSDSELDSAVGSALHVAENWSDSDSGDKIAQPSHPTFTPIISNVVNSPLGMAIIVAEEWSDSEDEATGVISAEVKVSFAELGKDSDVSGNEVIVPASPPTSPLEPGPAILVADSWGVESGDEVTTALPPGSALSVAEEWGDDSDVDIPVAPSAHQVVDSGDDASEEGSPTESRPPSRLENDQPVLGAAVHFADTWGLDSDSSDSPVVSTSAHPHTYTAQDFAYLHEDMFGDASDDDPYS